MPIYAVGAEESLIASSDDLKKFQPLEEIYSRWIS